MLQYETLPPSLAGLLWVFRSCFTAPSFRTFTALLAGMAAQPGRRTVCGMLTGAGLAGVWHHSRAHWFFGRARCDVTEVGIALLGLVVDRFLAPGVPVVIAVDDTLFRRSGRRVAHAGWYHDGAANSRRKDRPVAWGNCWVIAGVVAVLPFLDRPVCLPVAFRLCHKADSKQVIACQLVARIAAALPGRTIHVVADAWYAGADGASGAGRGAARGRGLPPGVSLTSRLRVNAALYAIATPTPGKAGRPKRIGQKLGTAKDFAATAVWTLTPVRRYGRVEPVQLAQTICLWYGVYRSRAIRVILVRDQRHQGGTATGVDLALVTTDLTSPAATIVERYAARWSIEVAIEDAKQHTGVGQARNRTARAVERTVPFGLITQAIVVTWYAQHGHHPDIAAARRRAAPWYRTKTQPAYTDMIITLRRVLITARFLQGKARTPTPEETRAVQLAWAEAAA
jgi:hypothetical protein